jgi:hypothetical protein
MRERKVSIRSVNFISKNMTMSDINAGLAVEGDLTLKQRMVYLIEYGWIERKSNHFSASRKLLEFVFLPDMFITTREQREYLGKSSTFTKEDLMCVMNDVTLFKLKELGYLFTDANMRYRRTDKMDNWLSDYIDENDDIKLK